MHQSKAVFLDLQGTLGGEGLGDIRAFSFYPSAAPAIRLLRDAGLPVIIVTNQSHIAKGYFTLDYFWRRIGELRQELVAQGTDWDGVYCCPHAAADRCSCIKPEVGMLRQARTDFGLTLGTCFLVGDMGSSDMVLARRAGCRAVLVRTGVGEGSLTDFRHTWRDVEPDVVAADVLEAARWIVRQEADSAGQSGLSERLTVFSPPQAPRL